MSWEVLGQAEITDEDRRVMADLIEEERKDRERGFWDVGLDPERNGGFEYAE